MSEGRRNEMMDAAIAGGFAGEGYSRCYSVSFECSAPLTRPFLFHILGMVAWGLITPLDVLKTRIQADPLSSPKYVGVVDCVLKSYREAGLPVFFRGMGPSVARAFPTNAATLVVFSWILALFDH